MTEENPIIEEIRQTRERLLAQHKDDLDSLVTHLQQSAAARNPSTKLAFVAPEEANLREPALTKKVG